MLNPGLPGRKHTKVVIEKSPHGRFAREWPRKTEWSRYGKGRTGDLGCGLYAQGCPSYPHPPDYRPGRDPENVVQVIRPYGVGIDCHSKFIVVCVLRKRGANVVAATEEFDTHYHSLISAAAWARQEAGIGDLEQLRYTLESTGTYHMPVMLAFGGIPSVVNPLLAGPTRRKTDVLDARLLAHHSITGMWPESFIPSQQAQVLRVMYAQRREVRRTATRCTNRVNNLILRFGHTFAADVPIKSMKGSALVDDLCAGKHPFHPGVHPQGLPQHAAAVVKDVMEQYRAAAEAADEWMKECIAYIEANDWPSSERMIRGSELLELLRSVPGVGIETAVCWLAEVCDPRRFESNKQVAAFCGCDPSLKVSAGKVTEHVRRNGNVRVHFVLSHAAGSHLCRGEDRLACWGNSIRGRHKKGGYQKAVGAISRRMAIFLYHVHRTGKPFNPELYTFGAVPEVPDIPLAEMGLGRTEAILEKAGYTSSREVIKAFYSGLGTVKGVGETCLEKVKEWLNSARVQPSPSASSSSESSQAVHARAIRPPRANLSATAS